MIELTILELLYLVLIFFGIVIGTLLTMILLNVLKIAKVASELSAYYYSIKNIIHQGVEVPQAIVNQFRSSKKDDKNIDGDLR